MSLWYHNPLTILLSRLVFHFFDLSLINIQLIFALALKPLFGLLNGIAFYAWKHLLMSCLFKFYLLLSSHYFYLIHSYISCEVIHNFELCIQYLLHFLVKKLKTRLTCRLVALAACTIFSFFKCQSHYYELFSKGF